LAEVFTNAPIRGDLRATERILPWETPGQRASQAGGLSPPPLRFARQSCVHTRL